MAVQYEVDVQYMANTHFSVSTQHCWRTIQDRAPPLTHRRPVRVILYCSIETANSKPGTMKWYETMSVMFK